MWLRRSNTTVRVTRSTEDERHWLEDYLMFSDDSLRWRRGGGSASNKDSLFNKLTVSFPAGLLPLVKKAAPLAGFDIQVDDQRTGFVQVEASADVSWLRDYQLEALDKIVTSERGIIWAPTGSGKTEIVIAASLRLPCRWLFLVHRTNLMDQAAGRYELRTKNLAGRIGEGVWNPSEDETGCTFATFQSVSASLNSEDPEKSRRARELLEGAEAIAVDECHTLPAESFWRLTMAAKNARVRVGLSGTPLARGDRRSLLAIAAIGPIIYRIKATTLIDQGVIARPKIRMIEVRHHPSSVTWASVYRECVVTSAVRNNAIIQAALVGDKPGFIFVENIQHGRLIEKLLWKNGLRAEFVWGTHSVDARNRMIRDLVDRDRIDMLVCSKVFQEGVDVAGVRSIIVASGKKSVIATLQRAGRGMRIERDAQGNVIKNRFQVWDILDKGCGCKTDAVSGKHKPCEWLEKHARARLNAYATEGYETVVEPLLKVKTASSLRKS